MESIYKLKYIIENKKLHYLEELKFVNFDKKVHLCTFYEKKENLINCYRKSNVKYLSCPLKSEKLIF